LSNVQSLPAVDVLTAERNEAWDRYLSSRPGSLIYQTTRFKDFLKDLLKCEEQSLVATVDGEIRGVLPLLYTDGEAGRVYNSLPYYGSNGGIMADNPETFRSLCDAYAGIVRRAGALSATLVGSPFEPDYPFAPPHTHQDVRIGQATMLPAGGDAESALASIIDSSARRNAAKARNAGVTVETNRGALIELQAMHVAGMAAIGGLAKTDRFFSLLAAHFRSGVDYDIYVARKDGIAIAALLLFYFNQTVEYYTPASDPEARSLQPLGLILMQAMADAATRGFRVWNWGGTWTTQEGVYRFKKKWGAADKQYTYYTHLNDDAVLDWTASQFLAAYPGFYVVPFSALRSRQ
jgi:CelD/BcsL family acetyltransferase involved in cellulose biosynthesis